MADFKDVVEEIKKTNQAIDNLTQATDPKGAGATEDKRDAEQWKTNQLNYLKTIADAVGGGAGGKGGPGKEDKKLGGIFAGVGRALGALGSGVGKGVGGFMKGIGAAAGGGLGFVAAMTALGAGLAAFGIAIGAATWVVSKMMPDIAKGLKEFDGVDGKNLIQVGAGIAALGGGFTAMGIGTAAAGIGNLVGGIAEGIGSLFGVEGGEEALIEKLKKFSALKLDAVNIKNNSEAMVAYGIAMTAAGAGKALAAIGTFAEGVFGGLGKMFGAVPPLESLKIFAKTKIDKDIVKNNAEAMAEYTKAMALGAGAKGLEALGSLANFVTTGVDGLSKLMGGKSTLKSLLSGLAEMSAATGIDKKKIQNVSDALISYTGAMALGAAAHTATALGSVGNLVTSAADGLSKLIGGKSTLTALLKGLAEMSAATGIDGAKIKVVAAALVDYTGAMALGAGASWAGAVGGIGNLIGSAVDGLTSFITGGKKKSTLDTMLTSLKTMSAATGIDGAKIKLVAAALVDYAGAMALGAKGEAGKAGASIGVFVGSAVDGLTSFITGGTKKSTLDTMLISLQKISKAEGIDGAKIKLVAQAMVSYNEAMAAGAKGAGGSLVGAVSNFASGVVKGIGSFFGIKDADPLGDLKKFAKTIITPKEVAQITQNSVAITAYAEAMVKMGTLNVTKSFGKTLTNLISGIGSLFGGSGEKDPMAALKNFALLKLDGKKIKKDITSLLSILEDPNINIEKSVTFKTILNNIASGLAKFTAPGGFVGLLAAAGQSMLKFLKGDKSPIEQIELIAGKSKELKDGADAIGKISDGLEKMASLKFDGGDIKIKDFAEDLLQSVPLIEAAIMGGKVEKSLLSSLKWWKSNKDKEFVGLASADIQWSEASKNIKMLRVALGMEAATDMGGAGGGAGEALKSKTIGTLHVNTLIAQTLINKALEKSAAGQGGDIIDASSKVVDASQKTSNATYQNTPLDNPNKMIGALNSF